MNVILSCLKNPQITSAIAPLARPQSGAKYIEVHCFPYLELVITVNGRSLSAWKGFLKFFEMARHISEVEYDAMPEFKQALKVFGDRLWCAKEQHILSRGWLTYARMEAWPTSLGPVEGEMLKDSTNIAEAHYGMRVACETFLRAHESRTSPASS